MINERENQMQEGEGGGGQILGINKYGENRDANITDYEAMVNSITTHDMKRLARRYFDLGHYAVGTLKPEN
jgi:hypothetical protein